MRQERPGVNTWTIWRQFLDTLCTETNGDTVSENKSDYSINREQRFSIGTMIKKYWSSVPYKGTVIGNTGKYYKLRYEDNDEEELNNHGKEQGRRKNDKRNRK
jgi:hypothetical protein